VLDEEGNMVRRVNMPKKRKHRMRAHINPMNEIHIPVPKNPDYCNWQMHYPSHFGVKDNNGDEIVVNTAKFRISYDEKASHQIVPTILDIGCGYGGLMFALSKHFPDQLILGQEIRDKVANFVAKKINTLRINSGYKDCMNLGVVRTNTMKTIHNYFKKESVEKMFICFADPHFKKVNWRRRIINQNLLTDYAYILKAGGRIYEVTDVKDLHDWNCKHLDQHPLFERIPEEELKGDPCIAAMREETDEAQKVIRNNGSIWHAVYRKRDESDKSIDEKCMQIFM